MIKGYDIWHSIAVYIVAAIGVATCELLGFLNGPDTKGLWFHIAKIGVGVVITAFLVLKDDEIILPSPKVQGETPEQKQFRILGMKNNFRRRLTTAFSHGMAWPTLAAGFANLVSGQ